MRISRVPKALIKKGLAAFGYQLQALPSGDAFSAQRALLSGRRVDLILDAGAYLGDVATQYHRLFPTASIHCFEPFPDSYRECVRRVGSFAKVHNVGVAEETGTRVLHMNAAPYTNSLLRLAKGTGSFVDPTLVGHVGEVSVHTVALDAFCREQSIEHAHILKLDVQGAELIALKGAEALLSNRAIDLIYLEVNFAPIYKEQAALCDLEFYLRKFGYRLVGFYDPHVTSSGSMVWADAIFIADTLAGTPEWTC